VKILRRILLSIFVLVAVSQWCLAMYFRAAAPKTPDYGRGAIYPVRIQGSSVYLTRAESYCYNDWVLYIGFVLGMPVIFYEVMAHRKLSQARQEREA
jgi:cytochrome c oxidase assembly protein Cox11